MDGSHRGLHDAFRFGVKHRLHRRAHIECVPRARLDANINPHFIRRQCGRHLAEQKGMEPHMVQSPFLAGLENLSPRLHISWRMAGQTESLRQNVCRGR